MLNRRTVLVATPYVLWMALQFTLPATAWAYAVRSGIAALALVAFWRVFGGSVRTLFSIRTFGWGALVGLVVLALWILPEQWTFYRKIFTYAAESEGPSMYDPTVCGWMFTLVRLIGSAFVIAPGEELFFRFFLYRRLQSPDWEHVSGRRFDTSAFLWTVTLFALEHDRWLAGAMAGALYGFVAMRVSVSSAVIAHIFTNLLLGLWVIASGSWAFW